MKLFLTRNAGQCLPGSRVSIAFLRMIKGEATDEEIDDLEEASALRDVAHMPARVKCAVLGWHTLDEALKKEEQGA